MGVSFDDLPSSTHVILTTNKHRAKLPSRRRPTGKGHVANGNGHVPSDSNGNGHDRLALPSEENDYDGDESEMSYSHIKRGRRSMKRKQPPMRTGIPLSTFAHKNSDSDEKQIVHSKNCDSSNGSDRLLEAEQKRKAEDEKKKLEEERLKNEKRKQEEERIRMEEGGEKTAGARATKIRTTKGTRGA